MTQKKKKKIVVEPREQVSQTPLQAVDCTPWAADMHVLSELINRFHACLAGKVQF